MKRRVDDAKTYFFFRHFKPSKHASPFSCTLQTRLTCHNAVWWDQLRDHCMMIFSKIAKFIQNQFVEKVICDLISPPIFKIVLTN